MNSRPDITAFEQLPDKTRIPASPVRVVSLMRSSNVAHVTIDGETRRALAYLVTVYSLRGTYQVFAWLARHDRNGGTLFGGARSEVAVSRHDALESGACQWLAQLGFEMRHVDLASQDLATRISTLAALPFSHQSKGDVDGLPAGGDGAVVDDGALTRILGDGEPVDALRRLRDVLIAG